MRTPRVSVAFFMNYCGLTTAMAIRALHIWRAAAGHIHRWEKRHGRCSFRGGRALNPLKRADQHRRDYEVEAADLVWASRPLGEKVVALEGAIIKALYRLRPKACVNLAKDARGRYEDGQCLYVVALR